MNRRPVHWLVVLGALAGFFLMGHFCAGELTEPDTGRSAVPGRIVTWTELQEFFDDCLTSPRALENWQGAADAGLVVVLVRLPAGGGYQVAASYAGGEMAGLLVAEAAVDELSELQRGLGVGRELVVTSCGTGRLDEETRERFLQEFRAEFMVAQEK